MENTDTTQPRLPKRIFVRDLMSSFDRGEQVDVLALDFSKAFDTVPHNTLLHKVKEYGNRCNILDWLKDFLFNREMTVVVDGESSTSIHMESGVRQGTVLGPILFLSHINDLPTSVNCKYAYSRTTVYCIGPSATQRSHRATRGPDSRPLPINKPVVLHKLISRRP
jgi:hypothetical protein